MTVVTRPFTISQFVANCAGKRRYIEAYCILLRFVLQ